MRARRPTPRAKTTRRTVELAVAAALLVAVLLFQLTVAHTPRAAQQTTLAAASTAPPTPQPSPRPTLTLVPTSLVSSYITRAIARTNMYRAEYAPTCPQLQYNAQLTLAAYLHSQDMALHGFLSHYGSDGSTVPERLKAAGYHFSTWAENVTWYAPTPEQAIDDWFNETPPNDGHRRNILGCTLTQVGIGFYYNPHDSANAHYYWTEDFGAPCNPYCL
jgi:uncharacterized protein YkwD